MTMDDNTPAAVAISPGLREELERKEIEVSAYMLYLKAF